MSLLPAIPVVLPGLPGLKEAVLKAIFEKGLEYAKAYLKNPANHRTVKLWLVKELKSLVESNGVTWDDELDDILAAFLGV